MEIPHILVVEDENLVAKDIQSRLQGLGYSVPAVAASAAEALKKAAEIHPDLVLMDIVLKGEIDGVQAARRMREQFGVPVVYLTAHGDEDTLEQAKASEPFGYILKPFDERELHSTIKMALYKSRMEKELRESREWLWVTLQSIGDAVVATDAAGSVLFMNGAAESLTGWEQKEALGKEVAAVLQWVDGKTGEPVENPVIAVLREGSSVTLRNPVALVAREGTHIPTEGCCSAIRNAGGERMGVVLVFRDVRERRRAQGELERANRLKSDLLDVLSHELKTPLNVIAGYAGMMQEKLVHDQDQVPGKIIKHVRDLSLMLDGLLELSRVETGAVDVVREETRLGLFLDELRSLYDFPLGKDVVLEWDYPLDLPAARIDIVKLRQILQNLINNAIKFTRQGKVTVRARCLPQMKSLEVKVTDTGVGIPPEKIPLIFERFRQVGTPVGAAYGGVGLGLHIVRTFTEMLGGKIQVESTPGTGSAFTIVVPYDL